MSDKIAGTAVIRSSSLRPDEHAGADSETSTTRDDGFFGVLEDAVAGIPYAFELEVTVPGHDPYVVGVRSRVPAKAEKVSLLQRHPIPLTLEVPVQVKADDLTRVAIDWPAFLALPDRVPRLLAARDRALAIQVQRMQAAKPDQYAAQQQQNSSTVQAWANAVRAGSMTRQQLVDNAAVLVRLGQMRQEDVDAALASLDAG